MRVSFLLLAPLVGAAVSNSRDSLEQCPGYKAVNVDEQSLSFRADLTLNGDPCDAYGDDLQDLKLLVEYQDG
jgi:alpha-glucosidase